MFAKNCKGRGFFDYTVTVNARQATPTNYVAYTFNLRSPDGKQKSFQDHHPDADQNQPNSKWHYSITIQVNEGSKVVRTISAGDGNPNPEGVSTREANGIVYINILE